MKHLEPFQIIIPEGDFSKVVQNEMFAFMDLVKNWIYELDENKGNPFAYNLFGNLGNEIEVMWSGRGRRPDQIVFNYKKQSFNPFFFHRIYIKGSGVHVVEYSADPHFENLSYEEWNEHPNVLAIRNKLELKSKIKGL